jgi:hypothetical protein
MFEKESIQAILKNTLKGYDKAGDRFTNPNPIYHEAADMAQEIRVHADPRVKPVKLFAKKAPNETQKEHQYRMDSYANNTSQYWNRALSMVNRIWNKQNWSLSFKEPKLVNEGEGMAKYIYEDYPRGQSFIEYFVTKVSKQKDNDPNSVIVIRPSVEYRVDENGRYITDDQGRKLEDDTKLPKPVAFVYPSSRVIDYVDDEYALILMEDKSVVSVGGIKRNEGLVFEFYDNDNIWRISQIGEKHEYRFEYELIFTHNIGYLPAEKLTGVPIGMDDNKGRQLYKSPFYDAVPTLNTALYNNSNLNISVASHVFLEKWEYVNECTTCNGMGKVLHEGEEVGCDICNGRGTVNKLGPMNVIQVKTPTDTIGEDDNVKIPPGGYITKPTEILEFLSGLIQQAKDDAFKMVNIDMTGQATGTETATGRFIDREEMMSFLMLEAQQNFDLLDKCLYYIGYMRYGTNYTGHVLTRPNEFNISTSADLTAELKEAADSKVSPILRGRLEKQYATSRFNNDKVVKELDIIQYVDGLAYMDEVDIMSRLNAGVIAKWQVILHDMIGSFIDQKLEENPEFLESDKATIKAELVAMAKELSSEVNPTISSETIINGIVGNA